MEKATEFPKTLAAVESQDRNAWKIADAVLAEVGESPGKGPASHGNAAKFEALSGFLADHGHAYLPKTLQHYRQIAEAYPRKRRRPELSFSVHQVLRDPDLADEFVEATGGPADRTFDKAREFRAKKQGRKPKPRARPLDSFEGAAREAVRAAAHAQAILAAHAELVREGDRAGKAVERVLRAWLPLRRELQGEASAEVNGDRAEEVAA